MANKNGKSGPAPKETATAGPSGGRDLIELERLALEIGGAIDIGGLSAQYKPDVCGDKPVAGYFIGIRTLESPRFGTFSALFFVTTHDTIGVRNGEIVEVKAGEEIWVVSGVLQNRLAKWATDPATMYHFLFQPTGVKVTTPNGEAHDFAVKSTKLTRRREGPYTLAAFAPAGFDPETGELPHVPVRHEHQLVEAQQEARSA
jgi:hypothetical protein